ncbi:hypothetical protein [Roseateles aquatilis]|uniref:hypothetical protein n=1 Tax=Roseateles aquatilis TaxID=431061 RepID=UPI0011323129|nr:hypothetical protein [Roseateles aquatilis]
MVKRCLVSEIGGAPFLDDGLQTSSLATLACAVRQRNAGNARPLNDYLQPSVARQCYLHTHAQPIPELPSTELAADNVESIQATCQRIVKIMPIWRGLFSLPIAWKLLGSDLISSSNPLIPQYIFLGRRAFNGPQPLEEIIIHELSHIWVAMIAEVAPLAAPTGPIYTLPSGTSGKNAVQILYAATFATAVVRYFRACVSSGNASDQEIARLKRRESYAAGCLDIISDSNQLLEDGRFLAASCKRILES